MALIVEDGSIVDNATSYISLADARTYAAARGLTLPADDAAAEAALVRAVDYMEATYYGRWQGGIVAAEQPRAWPRFPVVVENMIISASTIPAQLKAAQVEAAVAIGSGVDPLPSGTTAAVTREKVGALETEYAAAAGNSAVPRVVAVERMLRALLNGGGALRVSRA